MANWDLLLALHVSSPLLRNTTSSENSLERCAIGAGQPYRRWRVLTFCSVAVHRATVVTPVGGAVVPEVVRAAALAAAGEWPSRLVVRVGHAGRLVRVLGPVSDFFEERQRFAAGLVSIYGVSSPSSSAVGLYSMSTVSL